MVAEEDGVIEAEEISEAVVVVKDEEAITTKITIEVTPEEDAVVAMVMVTHFMTLVVVTVTAGMEIEAGEVMTVITTILREDREQRRRSFIQTR